MASLVGCAFVDANCSTGGVPAFPAKGVLDENQGEIEMYACCVSMKLKGNKAEFVRTLEKAIGRLLHKQKGFQDGVSLVSPERNEAIAISFWDKKESAEAFSREKYPALRKRLSKTVEGVPKVETFEVANSTFHQGLTPRTFRLGEHFVPSLGRNYEGYVPTSNRNYK